MLCPEVYPGQVWDRPRCLRDAGNEDPPQFRGKITPGGGAKVSVTALKNEKRGSNLATLARLRIFMVSVSRNAA